MDGNCGLVVYCRRERFALLARYCGVGFDKLGHYATESLDTECQRSNVEQHDVAHSTFLVEDCALDRCTHSHYLIGVNALRRLFAEVVLHESLHCRNTARTTYEDYFVDVACRQLGIADGVLAWYQTSLNERVGQLFELSTGESLYQVLGHTALSSDIRQVDFRGSGARQLNLGFLGSLLESLHSHRVLGKVDALGTLEVVNQPVDDNLVEVIAAQVGVTIGGKHLEHAAAEFQNTYIERTSTEVEHCNLHVLVGLVNAVGERSSRRLVDDTLHVESGNLSGLLCGLSLRVAEVCRHGDYGIRHFLSQIVLSGLLHLLEHHCRNLLRRVLASVDVNTRVSTFVYHGERHACGLLLGLCVGLAHEALDTVDGVLRVGDGLTLGRIAHLALASLNEANHRRSGALALAVGYYHWFVALENGNTTVSCS